MASFARVVLVATLLVAALPGPAQSQWVRAAVGAGVGIAGGAVVTASAVVFRARFQQEYMDSADDLIHWQTIPMIAAPAAGIAFGLAGEEAQMGSIVGSTSGMAVGAAVGAGIGWLVSDLQESPWAGGVIGAGVGLTLGGLTGGILGWTRSADEEEGGDAAPTALHLGWSIRAP